MNNTNTITQKSISDRLSFPPLFALWNCAAHPQVTPSSSLPHSCPAARMPSLPAPSTALSNTRQGFPPRSNPRSPCVTPSYSSFQPTEKPTGSSDVKALRKNNNSKLSTPSKFCTKSTEAQLNQTQGLLSLILSNIAEQWRLSFKIILFGHL